MSNLRADKKIDEIIAVEGEAYTNNPNDSGGPTKFGITLATLTRYRGLPVTAADVEKLTRPEAFNVYRWLYLTAPGIDQLFYVSEAIAAEVMDTGVNLGTGRAIGFLQRALNCFNKRGAHYPDVAVNNIIGQDTVRALTAFVVSRGADGETVMLRALDALQGQFYIDLTERRPKDEDFAFGWFKNRIGGKYG